MKTNVGPNPLDRARYPIDPWRLVETSYSPDDLGLTETIFSVANGYLGMRGTPEEGRPTYAHGTFINGFHETWPIRHAENAYGFAKTGQTIVNAPDAKIMKIYVDDEPLTFGTSDLEEYERVLDFREGVLRRHLVWRTPSGKRVAIDSTRMVSMTQRHLSIQTLEITMLSGSAPIVISSQLLNRQDGKDEYHVPAAALGEGMDPRKASAFDTRVLIPQMSVADEEQMTLGYRCTNSGMTIAVSAAHQIDTPDPVETVVRAEDDLAKTVFRVDATEGSTLRMQKTVAYHTSRGVPVRELADRCGRTLDRAIRLGVGHFERDQRTWYDEFWSAADVEISAARAEDDEDIAAAQQAIRFNLFSLAQATARTDGLGVPAKGVTGSGYEGHYFWDTECYVVPFLCYTQPEVARNVMHARSVMLPAARQRALEMAAKGALFAWRTINGQEASAYYAAGTAQVHIDADIAYALMKYVYATGDTGYLIREGVDILVETARMWADLGFWRHNGEPSFHIHGVTGPDEYTTVVNNNLFTNVMARYNLEKAVETMEMLRADHPREHAQVVGRLDISPDEVEEWARCAAAMHIPYDEGLGIHPQDDNFLDREVWDLPNTPDEVRPLLLHYHPLVIYRFQVLKQTDVVLALFQQGNRFTPEQKRADFEYYDPITTGDSTLSAVVQSIVAAEVGYHDDALRYFYDALYVDLHNMHGNTVDGMHIASTGGVWGGLAFGFGGMRDYDGKLSFDPRLPDQWGSLIFRVQWHSTRMQVAVTRDQIVFTVVETTGARPSGELARPLEPSEGVTARRADTPGEEFDIPISVRGEEYVVSKGSPVVVPLADQGPRIGTHLDEEPHGGVRSDGSKITATVPTPIPPEVYEQEHIEGTAARGTDHPMVPHDAPRGSERLAEEANKAANLSNISQSDSAE